MKLSKIIIKNSQTKEENFVVVKKDKNFEKNIKEVEKMILDHKSFTDILFFLDENFDELYIDDEIFLNL